MDNPCVTRAVMRAMHAPVSPHHDVVPHASMLREKFRVLRRFGHVARLRCIIQVRDSFSFVTLKGSVAVEAKLSLVDI